MKSNCLIIVGLCISLSCSQKNSKEFFSIETSHPPDTASIFAEGLISSHTNEYNITFSPDGNLVLFTIANNSEGNMFYTLFETRKKQGKWSKPEIVSFSGRYSDADPFFAPSGNKMYFISTRPVKQNQSKSDFDIWYVDSDDGEFGIPQHLGNDVNSGKDELYPAVSEKGNLYFSTENDTNGYDIVVSAFTNSSFQRPVSVGDSINTSRIEFDAFIAPDESYMIYTGMTDTDNFGSGDLYISFRMGNQWTRGKNLGRKVNSLHMDQCPMISLDGKILYFTSFRDTQPYPVDKPMSTQAYLNLLNSPMNGSGNIFWVDFRQIMKSTHPNN